MSLIPVWEIKKENCLRQKTYEIDSVRSKGNIGHQFLTEMIFNDCNGTRTHNHLVRKRTLNHLAKLTDTLTHYCWRLNNHTVIKVQHQK